MAGSSKESKGWWQLFVGSPYPAYVTCIHPKVFGMTLKKKQSKVSELLVDDILDKQADPDAWDPKAFTIKRGTCVLVLPDDAENDAKKIVSQPWMVRVNEMYFFAQTDKDEGPTDPKVDPDIDNYETVLEWEREQIRQGRISVHHFKLEANFFYRLSDLQAKGGALGEKEGPWDKQQKKNRTAMCDALLKLGIVETKAAAKELIKKQHSGTSRASRLLNRFIAYSTHEALLPSSQPTSEEEEEEEAQDFSIPMDSVMSPFKVMYLKASQGLPYMPAPVPQEAEQAQIKTHKRAALLEGVQEQHQELPRGYFCCLMYIKQTNELVPLEDWASGKAVPSLQEDWAQHSRQQVKQLLQQTQQELAAMRQQRQQQQRQAGSGALDALADAAEDAVDADADDDDARFVSISDGEDGAPAAAVPGQQPGTPQQQQHSQQLASPTRQPQRKTSRKSQNPRMASQQQQEQRQPQRWRLRSAAAAAAGAADDEGDSDVQMLSSDQSEPPSAAATSGEEEEQEEEQERQPRKKRRAAALQESSSSEEQGGKGDSSSEAAGSSEDGSAAQERGRAGGKPGKDEEGGGQGEDGSSEDARGSGSGGSSQDKSGSEDTEQSEESDQAAAAAAKQPKRAAAAAKKPRGRPPAAAADQRHTRSVLKTSKGAVLRSGR